MQDSTDGSLYQNDPDVLLMLEFQRGNRASFEALMRKYYKRIYNFVYRFVMNRDTAEDLTQEVFMRVYFSSTKYRPSAKFQTWIYTIAKNISLNELRRRKYKTISLDQPLEVQDGVVFPQMAQPKAGQPDQELLRKEQLAAVMKAIHSLPANQKAAVFLSRFESFRYEQIAEILHCSISAVKSLLNRARENLKLKMQNFIDMEEH